MNNYPSWSREYAQERAKAGPRPGQLLSEDEFRNKFRKVTFAILDKDGEDGKFSPFYKMFKK